jgi:hypothetical protein
MSEPPDETRWMAVAIELIALVSAVALAVISAK